MPAGGAGPGRRVWGLDLMRSTRPCCFTLLSPRPSFLTAATCPPGSLFLSEDMGAHAGQARQLSLCTALDSGLVVTFHPAGRSGEAFTQNSRRPHSRERPPLSGGHSEPGHIHPEFLQSARSRPLPAAPGLTGCTVRAGTRPRALVLVSDFLDLQIVQCGQCHTWKAPRGGDEDPEVHRDREHAPPPPPPPCRPPWTKSPATWAWGAFLSSQ